MALLLALMISACAPPAQAQLGFLKNLVGSGAGECGKTGPLEMPPGVDIKRLQLLDENKRMAVYTAVTEADLGSANKRRLPQEVLNFVDLSNTQLNRMFSDAVKRSRRFSVFDSKATLTNEFSNVMVDLQVTSAKQMFVPVEPTRQVVKSFVSVSLNLQDMLTGEDLLGDAFVVDGITGDASGARLVLTSADDRKSPEVRTQLGSDYVDALKDAFWKLRIEMESKLRPVAKVLRVEGCSVGLAGGQKHGFQAGDELVVFQAKTVDLGGKKTLAGTVPVALMQCAGVGTDTSECTVKQVVPGYKPTDKDYAVITTESMNRSRER